MFILILVLFMLLPAAIWSQSSLVSQASFGLFPNAYDAAGNVSDAGRQPTFSSLERNYLFGGLTNFYNLPTGAQYTGVPFTIGYYRAGDNPWSVFSDTLIDTESSTRANGVTATTTARKDVTLGTDITGYTWTDSSTENQYDYLEAWDVSAGARFLLGLKPMNIGLGANVSFEQKADTAWPDADTWADFNRTLTETWSYDTAAAIPTQEPTPAVDYTKTSVLSFPDTEFILDFGIPAFFRIGDGGLFAEAGFTYAKRDQSWSQTESYTPPQDAVPGTFFDAVTEDTVTDVTGSIALDLDTILSLNPIKGDHQDDHFDIGLNGGFQKNTAEESVSTTIVQDFTYTGSGAALQVADAGGAPPQDDITTQTREGTTAFDVNVYAQHFNYHNLGDQAVLGMAPRLQVGTAYSPLVSTYPTQSVTVSKTDGNADGLYDNALDTIDTTTATFYNYDDGGNFDIITSFSLPAAVTFRPNNGPFGVTVGADVGVDFTVRKVKDIPATFQSTITAVDGTGAVAVPTIGVNSITAETRTETVSTTTAWNFNAEYALGINFFLPNDATINIIFKGAFWNDRLEIAAYIPLK